MVWNGFEVCPKITSIVHLPERPLWGLEFEDSSLYISSILCKTFNWVGKMIWRRSNELCVDLVS